MSATGEGPSGAAVASLLDRLLVERWDDALERAVRDAAAAVDAPIAVVSLFTRRLQLFAAHVGLPPELEVSRALSREVSICRVVVDLGAVLQIGDVVDHPELRPELTDMFNIRAYLGAPLRVDGVVVGALCAMDTRAREFGADAVARLERLAAVVEVRLADRARSPQPGGVDVAAAELLPYLRLLQATQLGALTPEAMTRALRMLPPVPSGISGSSGIPASTTPSR